MSDEDDSTTWVGCPDSLCKNGAISTPDGNINCPTCKGWGQVPLEK